MANFFMDTDAGSDASDGTTWANAKLTLEGLLAVMSAGDSGFIQGAATDTAASSRTFTSPGTNVNPCRLVGVADGTTNEPPVVGDLASATPKISNSVAGSDIIIAGAIDIYNIHITSVDRINLSAATSLSITNGQFTYNERFEGVGSGSTAFVLYNSILEPTATGALLHQHTLFMYGGSILFTAAADIIRNFSVGSYEFYGVDISGLGSSSSIINGANATATALLSNCSLPATYNLFNGTPTLKNPSVTVLASDNTSSLSSTSSIQEYRYEDLHGSIDLETTAVRTGGADDGATGVFSYAMTPHANATLESSNATLKSPWMAVWLSAGANTLTVHIANDSASTDYLEDEVWVEFYTPDADDTAQHDQNFDPANARLLDSTTIITDDTGSIWGAGGNNHQKLSVTVTTGFEGWAYATLHLAKRQSAPDTLFLDPKIEVS